MFLVTYRSEFYENWKSSGRYCICNFGHFTKRPETFAKQVETKQ
nr:MAG TPA: hypothetical protein [Caudoviricetes sp.]